MCVLACVHVCVSEDMIMQDTISKRLWDFPRVLGSSQMRLITLRSRTNIYFAHVDLICAPTDEGPPHVISRALWRRRRGGVLFIYKSPSLKYSAIRSIWTELQGPSLMQRLLSPVSRRLLRCFSHTEMFPLDLISDPWAQLLYLSVLHFPREGNHTMNKNNKACCCWNAY